MTVREVFKVEIDCSNDAFGTDRFERAEEIAGILDKLMVRMYGGDPFDGDGRPRTLYDDNGNEVGAAWFDVLG